MNIMIIEDQRDVVEMLRLNWSDSRDRLESLASVRQANRFIHSNELAAYDCILIDINLIDGSGLEVLRDARSRSDVPIIMISGAGDADSRADAISVGADDYVMKPFSVKELRARVHRLHDARQGRLSSRQSTVFKIGNVDCDIGGLSLHSNGVSQPLTALEARILQVLHEKAGTIAQSRALHGRRCFASTTLATKRLTSTSIGFAASSRNWIPRVVTPLRRSAAWVIAWAMPTYNENRSLMPQLATYDDITATMVANSKDIL